MANDRWRVLRKVQWKQVIDPLDGSYVGWRARHHKNDKRDRYRRWKRSSKQEKLPYHAKFGKDIKAVHGGTYVGQTNNHWSATPYGKAVVTKTKSGFDVTQNVNIKFNWGDED